MPVDFRSLQERARLRVLAQISAGEVTGAQLARETGFRQAHISNFLNRKRGLSLEAIDAIVKTRKIGLADLMREPGNSAGRRRSLRASAAELSYIPLMEEENCLASDIPYAAARNALRVMYSRLAKLPVRMHTPRPHWLRFVALRVTAADAKAMSPRLTRGAIVVVDRHSNAAGDNHSIYAARAGKRIVLRYVECAGVELVLRPHDPECELMVLEAGGGHDALAAIIGRVCMVMGEV